MVAPLSILGWVRNPISSNIGGDHDGRLSMCSHCSRQSSLRIGDSKDARRGDADPDGNDQLDWVATSEASSTHVTVTTCPMNCGTPYCGEVCLREASSRHLPLCVGRPEIIDETHPLYRYKIMALEELFKQSSSIVVYSTLMLALELVLCNNNATTNSSQEDVTTDLVHELLLIRQNNGDGGDHDHDDNDTVMAWADSSYDLLCEITTTATTATLSSRSLRISLQEWKKLLLYVLRNVHSVKIPSIWASRCRDLTTQDGWTLSSDNSSDDDNHRHREEQEMLLQEANARWNRVDDTTMSSEDEDEDVDEDEDDNNKSDNRSIPAVVPVDVVQLMDEPDHYFPPLECMVLLAPTANLEHHSCIPTHELRASSRGGVGSIQNLELRKIPPSEGGGCDSNNVERNGHTKTTVSLIDHEESLAERTEMLALRGVKFCRCLRCCFERTHQQRQPDEQPLDDDAKKQYRSSSSLSSSHNSFTHDDLVWLLSLAKVQRRIEDAMIICDLLVQANAHHRGIDGSDSASLLYYALFERARIVGWMGHYSRRERLLEEAAASAVAACATGGQAPIITSCDNDDNDRNDGLAQIQSALAEVRAYYRRDWTLDKAIEEDREILDNYAKENLPSSFSYADVVGLEDQAFVMEGLLDADECKQMIDLAEEYQMGGDGSSSTGWTTSRHYAVPTTDVPIYRMDTVLVWFNRQLKQRIFPILERQFVFQGRLRIFDAFLVKYDAAMGQKRLPLHNDQSVYSLTIALNSSDEYEGGGTYFADTGTTIRTDAGGMVSFCGELLHAGRNIHKGRRYIIACFIYVEDDE